MRRAWNWERETPGTGMRFAQALGCISTQEYVLAVLKLAGDTNSRGAACRIIANRVKLDPTTGEPLTDHKETGDYKTVGYRFEIGEESWNVDRFEQDEGEQIADDYSHALGIHTDRGFCEAMVQIKTILDRLGGQVFIQPYAKDGDVVAYACEYQHLVRDTPREPDSGMEDLEEADESEEPAEAEAELEETAAA